MYIIFHLVCIHMRKHGIRILMRQTSIYEQHYYILQFIIFLIVI